MDAAMTKGFGIIQFQKWLRERELSENTVRTYSYAVKEFLGKYGGLTRQNLIAYKSYLIGNREAATACNRCIAINQYCVFCGKPELRLKTVKVLKTMSVENVISKEQYKTLLCALKEDGRDKWYYMILFLGKTGARVSELIRFRKADLEKGYCEIWTKGKIRKIRFPQSLVAESEGYFRTVAGEYLFPNRYGGQPTARGIRTAIKQMAERYGIDRGVMHPHSFRHLFAVEFLKRNKNIAFLADLMGHESVDTTAIYLRMSEQEQTEQLNQGVDW